MKKIILLPLVLCAVLLCGCNTTMSGGTVIEPVHSSIKPKDVTVFEGSVSPPLHYQQVADVNAVSRGTMQDAINGLKKEAAKVGANGLIVTWTGKQYGGSMGYSFGSATAYGNPYGATAFGSSTAFSVPIYYQCAKGTAIFVQQTDDLRTNKSGQVAAAQVEILFAETRVKAEKGDAVGQYNLGVCYYYGKGVPQDYDEAVKWFRKATEQNVPKAQSNLGVCYANGQGVAKDAVEAAKWYRKAAEQNDAVGQYNLGACCFSGQGVSQDYVEAYKWFNLAAAQGISPAKDSRNNVAQRMTPDQIADAQKLSREFQPHMESAAGNSN